MICANFGLPYVAVIGIGARPSAGSISRDIKQDILLEVADVEASLRSLSRKAKAERSVDPVLRVLEN